MSLPFPAAKSVSIITTPTRVPVTGFARGKRKWHCQHLLAHSPPAKPSRTLCRCVTGIDLADTALFDSALTQDATFDMNGTVMEGLDAIKTGCYNGVAKLDTTHFITNARIDVTDGASTAKMTASALAQHYRPGEGQKPDATRLLSGSLYSLDLVKDDQAGTWRIKTWKMKIVWTEGDWGVFAGN